MARILLFANTSWYLYNFRLALARAAREAGHEILLMSPPDKYATRLESEGFCWIGFPMSRRGLNPVTELLTVVRGLAAYRELRPDLVHHFTIKPVIYGSIAARIAGVHCVVNSIEGLGYLYASRKAGVAFLRAALRPVYRLALGGSRSWAVFHNPEDRGRFVGEGIVDANQTLIIAGAGVDAERFQPLPETVGDPVAVMASRMLWDKGVGDLVEAARILRDRGHRGAIILAGSSDPGNPSSIPEERLRRWSQEGLVTWVGHVEDIAELYAKAHIVVLPTKYAEGVPKTLLEAAASGRAMVATDAPGCREIVIDGVTGRLIPPSQPEALAEAIADLWARPEMRATMGRNARELVLTRFSDQHVNGQFLTLYDEGLTVRGGERKARTTDPRPDRGGVHS